jgi:hypothetical protein
VGVDRASIARLDSAGGVRAHPTCSPDLAWPSGSVRPQSADSTSGRRGREFKSPPPDQVRGGFRRWGPEPATIFSNQHGLNLLLVRGHKRFKGGAWRLTVNATDPVTGKRTPVYATVHAPNNKRGAAKADSETVAGRGGWANSTTPLQVYSRFRPARDAELARSLAERLDG